MVLFGDTLELTEKLQDQDKAVPCCVFSVPDSAIVNVCPVAPSFLLLLSLSMFINVCVPFCLLNGLSVTKVTPLC